MMKTLIYKSTSRGTLRSYRSGCSSSIRRPGRKPQWEGDGGRTRGGAAKAEGRRHWPGAHGHACGRGGGRCRPWACCAVRRKPSDGGKTLPPPTAVLSSGAVDTLFGGATKPRTTRSENSSRAGAAGTALAGRGGVVQRGDDACRSCMRSTPEFQAGNPPLVDAVVAGADWGE